ncbi:MAG TPA: hypothetical protein VNZ22_00305, partial [Bacillota bacterium]|nr:hypothetical protein [Bacillota bacterium]
WEIQACTPPLWSLTCLGANLRFAYELVALLLDYKLFQREDWLCDVPGGQFNKRTANKRTVRLLNGWLKGNHA